MFMHNDTNNTYLSEYIETARAINFAAFDQQIRSLISLHIMLGSSFYKPSHCL